MNHAAHREQQQLILSGWTLELVGVSFSKLRLPEHHWLWLQNKETMLREAHVREPPRTTESSRLNDKPRELWGQRSSPCESLHFPSRRFMRKYSGRTGNWPKLVYNPTFHAIDGKTSITSFISRARVHFNYISYLFWERYFHCVNKGIQFPKSTSDLWCFVSCQKVKNDFDNLTFVSPRATSLTVTPVVIVLFGCANLSIISRAQAQRHHRPIKATVCEPG